MIRPGSLESSPLDLYFAFVAYGQDTPLVAPVRPFALAETGVLPARTQRGRATFGSGRVVVQSRIVPIRGEATELDYVMNQTPTGWKVVDVLAAGQSAA
jgi:hypothetical protein